MDDRRNATLRYATLKPYRPDELNNMKIPIRPRSLNIYSFSLGFIIGTYIHVYVILVKTI